MVAHSGTEEYGNGRSRRRHAIAPTIAGHAGNGAVLVRLSGYLPQIPTLIRLL